jgi:hypothetical protein
MDMALSVLALVAGGLVLELYSAAWSSLGSQGEHGFHLGSKAYLQVALCPSGKRG